GGGGGESASCHGSAAGVATRVAMTPRALECELFRMKAGESEEVNEVAFAPTGEYFLTRDRRQGSVSLWSIRPVAAHLQTLDKVCCSITSASFLQAGKAIALGHSDCTLKVYSCETGEVLACHALDAPPLCAAAVPDLQGTPALLAAAGGCLLRYPLPPWGLIAGSRGPGGSLLLPGAGAGVGPGAEGGSSAWGSALDMVGSVRSVTALPVATENSDR
ncbi:unnamed protein product, partial [Discosporangium mesarthrocarpum]